MNVSRSTVLRWGRLLTAFAVAVLLAGFSGTAWAQISLTSSFRGGSGTLEEGADAIDLSEPRPLQVTITRRTRTKNDPYNSPPTGNGGGNNHLEIKFEYNGKPLTTAVGIKVTVDTSTAALIVSADGTANLAFAADTGNVRSETTTATVTETDEDGDDTRVTEEEMRDVTIAKTEIVLTIEDDRPNDDADWLPDELVMTLTKHPDLGAPTDYGTDKPTKAGEAVNRLQDPFVRDFSSKFTVKITDDDPTPKLKFVPTDIQLAKGNDQTLTVEIGTGAGGEGPLPGMFADNETDSISGKLGERTGEDDRIFLSVSPPDAVGPLVGDRGIISITDRAGIDLEPDGRGGYDIGSISQAVPDNPAEDILLMITAKDASGFRDRNITLMLREGRTDASKVGDGGPIDDADPATVTVLSGEETPTVTFSTDSISIDEGDSETVHLLAGGMQGDEVGSAAVSVRGDADISLEQNGNPISGTVSFGGNANAELTIVSNSDPSLEDGEEKTATVTITDASGAIIGDPGTVTVTVVGSTAVPVLPLFAQLFLALLLMVGGARLYRRRQG